MTSKRNLKLEAEQYFKETCDIVKRDHQNAFQNLIEKYEKLIVEDTDPIILDGETFKPIDGRIYKPAPLGSLTGYKSSDEIKKRIKIYQEMAFQPSKRVGHKTKASKKKTAKARKKLSKQKNQTSQSEPTTISDEACDSSPSTSEDVKVKKRSSSSYKCSKRGDMHNFDHAEKSYKRTRSKSVGQADLDEMYASRKYTALFDNNDYSSPNESYKQQRVHTATVTKKLNDTLRQKKSHKTPDYRQQPEWKARGKQQILDLTAVVNHENTSKRTKSFPSAPKHQHQKEMEMKKKVSKLKKSSSSQNCLEHAIESVLSTIPSRNRLLSHSSHNGQSRYATNKKSAKSNTSFPTELNNESQTPNSVSRRRIRSEIFHDSSENYASPIKRKKTSQVKSCQKRSRSTRFEEKYEGVTMSMEVLLSMK